METKKYKIFRNKFETYHRILNESGEKEAWDALFEGYPERQKQNLGKYINNCSLVEGFTKAIPDYKELGMYMNAIDISNSNIDGVLEIQHICPVLDMAKEFEVEKPCHILCEMDVAATTIAFPNINGKILSQIINGDCVCIFKYERERE